MFDHQVRALEGEPADYRSIRWDQRGFGMTACTGPFTYWDSAADGVGLLDELGVDQAVWIGMSQGGFLSLRAALAHPDRVRALVLIDSQAGVDDDATLDQYRGMLEVWEHGAQEEYDAVAEIVAGLIIGQPDLSAEWVAKWKQRDRRLLRHPEMCLVDRDDITSRLGEITCPPSLCTAPRITPSRWIGPKPSAPGWPTAGPRAHRRRRPRRQPHSPRPSQPTPAELPLHPSTSNRVGLPGAWRSPHRRAIRLVGRSTRDRRPAGGSIDARRGWLLPRRNRYAQAMQPSSTGLDRSG
ncbi:MAG: alpha/beta hydrolase [Acidimicrobiales bacterium]